jgi:outer membrane protein
MPDDFVAIAAVVAVAASLVTQPVAALDLIAAYELAVKNDPVYEASLRAYAAAWERVPQARAGLLPELHLTGETRETNGEVSFDDSPQVRREFDTRTVKLELTQPLLRVQSWAAYGQAKLLALQAEAQLRQSQQELRVRVAQAYFDLLAAQDNLAVAESQKSAVAAQLDLVSRGFKAGTATITDVHEARSRHDLATAQTIAVRSEIDIRRSALEQIVGPVATTLAPLRSDAELPSPQPPELAAWTEAAHRDSPSVQASRAAADAADREVSRARAGHVPTVDLVATYGRDYSEGTLTSPTSIKTETDSRTVGLQLHLPLFASGGTSAREREAVELAYRARAELETARRAAVHAARQAHSGVINGTSQINALTQAVKSSESAVEGNRIGYRVGTRLNVDVLNAEQQLHGARRDLARARYDTVLHGLRLRAAVGRLTDDDLRAVSVFLLERTAQPR